MCGIIFKKEKMEINWISVEATPPDPQFGENLLIWMKTRSGRGKAHIAALVSSEEENFWYNSDYGDEIINCDEVTHYAYITPPRQ